MIGLFIVHSKFDLKEQFYKGKNAMRKAIREDYASNSGSRKRRDDYSSTGYGDQYRETGQSHEETRESRTSGGYAESTPGSMSGAFIAQLVQGIELEESIGSPLIFAGLSIGSLLIASLLSFGEYCLVKKSGEVQFDTVLLNSS